MGKKYIIKVYWGHLTEVSTIVAFSYFPVRVMLSWVLSAKPSETEYGSSAQTHVLSFPRMSLINELDGKFKWHLQWGIRCLSSQLYIQIGYIPKSSNK